MGQWLHPMWILFHEVINEKEFKFVYYKVLDIQEWSDDFQLPSPDTVVHEDLDSLKWFTGGYSIDLDLE